MWKIFLIISITITSSYAADLFCVSFDATTGGCQGVDHITNVAAADEVINVNGQPSTYVDSALTSIYFNQNSQFDYFPTNIFKIFPNVQMVGLYNNSLRFMVTDAFNYCDNLQHISGNYQKFTDLPAGFAQNCGNVQMIDLTSGELRNLHPDALLGLTSLKYFTVMQNKITCLPPTFFTHTPNIEQITLHQNFITALDPITFDGLTHLHSLDTSYNLIKNIPNMSFENTATSTMSNYFTWMCSYNPLQAIDPEFIPTFFGERANIENSYTQISFDTQAGNNCLMNMGGGYISNDNYNNVHYDLAMCFENWTPSMAAPVSCDPTASTTTTTTTMTTVQPTLTTAPNQLTTGASDSTNSPCTCSPPTANCCQNGILQVILSAFRNMTFNVDFN